MGEVVVSAAAGLSRPLPFAWQVPAGNVLLGLPAGAGLSYPENPNYFAGPDSQK